MKIQDKIYAEARCDHKKNKAFVLPLILVLFAILSLLIQQEFESFITQKKLFFLLKEHQKQLFLAKNKLLEMEHNFEKRNLSPESLIESKWFHFGYVNVEDLTIWLTIPIIKTEQDFTIQMIVAQILEMPCVEFSLNHHRGAIFYQIVVRVTDKEQLHPLLLQAFWLQPAIQPFICKEDFYSKAVAGEQSLAEF